MNLTEARSAYNNLSTREALSDVLAARGSWPIELDTSDFGTVALSQCALRALGLDNLFSGRFQAADVEGALVESLRTAAETADPEDDLFFAVSFGRLGSARLMARAMPDYVQVFAAP